MNVTAPYRIHDKSAHRQIRPMSTQTDLICAARLMIA